MSGQPSLTEQLVEVLEQCTEGVTTMQLSLETRRPYPEVQAELESLAKLGIVMRRIRGRDTVWILG